MEALEATQFYTGFVRLLSGLIRFITSPWTEYSSTSALSAACTNRRKASHSDNAGSSDTNPWPPPARVRLTVNIPPCTTQHPTRLNPQHSTQYPKCLRHPLDLQNSRNALSRQTWKLIDPTREYQCLTLGRNGVGSRVQELLTIIRSTPPASIRCLDWSMGFNAASAPYAAYSGFSRLCKSGILKSLLA